MLRARLRSPESHALPFALQSARAVSLPPFPTGNGCALPIVVLSYPVLAGSRFLIVPGPAVAWLDVQPSTGGRREVRKVRHLRAFNRDETRR
jgi:hypothetical protein